MASACGPQRRVESNLATSQETETMAGRLVFKQHCQKCHPDGESGVGLPISNIKLPGFITRYKIRSRSLLLWAGSMPAFKKDEISRKEMDELITFIKYLHHTRDKK